MEKRVLQFYIKIGVFEAILPGRKKCKKVAKKHPKKHPKKVAKIGPKNTPKNGQKNTPKSGKKTPQKVQFFGIFQKTGFFVNFRGGVFRNLLRIIVGKDTFLTIFCTNLGVENPQNLQNKQNRGF